MPDLPDGTLTLFFSDIEGSTRHLLRLGAQYPAVFQRHRELLSAVIGANHGVLVDTQGDGCFAAFPSAGDALDAAVAAQRAFASEPWPGDGPIRVRIGLHTGEPMRTQDGYTGLDVHRAARICDAGHGGQILLSRTTRDLVAHALPSGVRFVDLGHHHLKGLTRPEQLIQATIDGHPHDFPRVRTLGSPMRLPRGSRPLIGRTTEVHVCRELLLRDDVNLVTLTGPGGTGKTRLAMHLAVELQPDFEDGVAFVSLAMLSDPGLVPRAVAREVGIQDTLVTRPLLDMLGDALAGRAMLLVLDNFEHLLPAAEFVAGLVDACPRLTVLVTSRQPLHLSFEREVPVPPLVLPNRQDTELESLASNDAVRLFVERAREIRADFALTEDSVGAVAEICRRLDGLPLAIELAAARVRLLPPRALLARLDRRLPMLAHGPRDVPPRQQTLRDTIAWSYGLLDEADRRVFRSLGVFVGGCSLPAAEVVCQGDSAGALVLDSLGSLVDKSLVRHELVGAEPRFTLLETIREFALEQLEGAGEASEPRRRHAGYFLRLAERADPHLIGPEQVAWLDDLEREHGNLGAALAWARETRAAGDRTDDGVPSGLAGLRLAGALHWYWWLGGHVGEGRGWLMEALSWDGHAPGSDATAVCEDIRPARARALFSAGVMTMIRGEYASAGPLYAEAISLAEAIGDPITLGRCLAYRTILENYLEDAGELEPGHAEATVARAIDILRGAGDTWGLALAQSLHAALVRNLGQHQRAAVLLEEAVALARKTGDRYLLGSTLPKLGNLLVELGDLDGGQAVLGEALAHLREIREGWWTSRCVHYLALIADKRPDPLLAALLFGAADATLEACGARRSPREAQSYARALARTRQALDAATFAEAYERGRSMSPAAVQQLLTATPAGAPAS